MARIPNRMCALLAALALSMPAAAVAGQEQTTTVDASRGGVTFASGVNSLTIGARVQFRWTADLRDEFDADTIGDGSGREDGLFTQFDVARVRVMLSGGVYQPWLRYSFQFDFGRSSGTGASKIKDAIIEIRPIGRDYRVQMGQFKTPFGLQQLVSSGRLQFVDRAITDSKFTAGRDVGVMVSGPLNEALVGYQAGIFNGAGESALQTTTMPLLVGRVFYQPLGAYALSEGAVDNVDRQTLLLGLSARTGRQARGRTATGVVENADRQTALGVELGYRRPRFQSTAEYFWMTEEVSNPVSGPDLDSYGFHAQAGYLVAPRTEVGIRYALVNGDADADEGNVQEVRGVVGYFWRAHNVKLQADVGQVRFGAGYGGLSARARAGLPALGTRLVSGVSLADTQVRVQMQVGF